METQEMIELLNSGNYIASAERYEISVQLKTLAERLREADAEIERLVRENGTMRASSPTMEWISVEDEPIPGEQYHVFTVLPKIIIKRNPVTGEPAYWMRLEPPKPKVPTFKDVFLKAFPKADYNIVESALCVGALSPQFNVTEVDCRNTCCEECWNQPYFEPEKEGAGDA